MTELSLTPQINVKSLISLKLLKNNFYWSLFLFSAAMLTLPVSLCAPRLMILVLTQKEWGALVGAARAKMAVTTNYQRLENLTRRTRKTRASSVLGHFQTFFYYSSLCSYPFPAVIAIKGCCLLPTDCPLLSDWCCSEDHRAKIKQRHCFSQQLLNQMEHS